MPDVPRHPDTPDGGLLPNARPATRRPWWFYALGATVVALVVLMVVLHLTGVIGAGSH